MSAIVADWMQRVGRVDTAARRTRHGHDPEAIHDLRVAIRRLLAALAMWRGLLRPARWKRVRRRLRALRRDLGPAREAEVHTELLGALRARQATVARRETKEVLARLERHRDRLRNRAVKQTAKAEVGSMLESLIAAGAALDSNGAVGTAAAVIARRRLSRLANDARRAIGRAARSAADEELHAARIANKKWRYALECLDPAGCHSIAPLLELQRTLGEIQDRVTLLTVLEKESRNLESADPLSALAIRLRRERGVAVLRFRRLARRPLPAAPA